MGGLKATAGTGLGERVKPLVVGERELWRPPRHCNRNKSEPAVGFRGGTGLR